MLYFAAMLFGLSGFVFGLSETYQPAILMLASSAICLLWQIAEYLGKILEKLGGKP